MSRTKPISTFHSWASNGALKVRAVIMILALPLVLLHLAMVSHAEEDTVEKDHTTIKESGKRLPDAPLEISGGIKKTGAETESLVQQAQSETSVEGEIESRDKVAYDPMARSIYPDAYYKIRELMRDWERKLGLELTFSYDLVGQQYADDVEYESGMAGDFSLSGRWLLFGQKKDRPVYLTFRLRSRHAINGNAPSDIGPDTGLFWKTISGFNDSGFQIPSMYLSQELRKRELILRYGQFSIDSFFDSHRFRSAKKYFLNYIFSNNPSVNFPSYGAGAILQWNPNEQWELIGGASNIQGTEQGKNVDFGLDSAALFESVQLRYRITDEDGRNSELRVMAWNNDSVPGEDLSEDRGMSATLGIDGLHAGEEFAFRCAMARGNSTPTDVHFFAGFGKTIHYYDHWGIGMGAGRSSESSKWQAMMETYYRWWVFKELIITPDFQLILGDHLDRDTEVSVVAGLRFGFIF